MYNSVVESDLNDLSGKVVAITGTSPGSMGAFIAKAATMNHAKCVILMNRPSDRSVKAEEGKFLRQPAFVLLDLTFLCLSSRTKTAFFQHIINREFQKLNLLHQMVLQSSLSPWTFYPLNP